MNTQLSFDLPARAALGRDDFFISPSNQIAVSMIDKWTQWSSRKLLLSGPEGAVPNLSTGPVAVENIHIIAGCEAQQTALFYLHNLCLETDQPILFTGRGEPQHWLLTLPDLESRLRGATLVQLHPPDDALLRAVLIKLFSDRQLSPSPELITYVVRRIDRSFDAAQKLVVALDALSLGEQRPLSRRLAARLLEPPQENLL